MQEFNHKKTIRLVCCVVPESVVEKSPFRLEAKSLEIDPEVRDLFQRNGVPTELEDKVHPYLQLWTMMKFLARNFLDGDWNQESDNDKEIITITIRQRPHLEGATIKASELPSSN